MELVNSLLRNYIKMLRIPWSGPKWLLAVTSLIIPWSKSYWTAQSYHSLPTSAAEIVNSCNMSNRRGIVSLSRITSLSLCIHHTFCKMRKVMFRLLWILTHKRGKYIYIYYYYSFLYYCRAQKFTIMEQYLIVLGACECKMMSLYSD